MWYPKWTEKDSKETVVKCESAAEFSQTPFQQCANVGSLVVINVPQEYSMLMREETGRGVHENSVLYLQLFCKSETIS